MSKQMTLATLVACSLAALTGCSGTKLVPVKGTVTLDGKPVEGATVTFISEDGKSSFAGSTDASGNFSLESGEKPGALPGNYKVTVVKSPAPQLSEAPDPNSPEIVKQMKKEAEESSKASKISSPDMKMKMMAAGKGVGMTGGPTSTVKSALPAIYASGTTTPLTAKVEPNGPPIALELKSK